jgi:hypothetical protein
MLNQPGEGRRFPATCARCGGRVTEPVSFCPHCGTHARLAFAGEAPRDAPAPKAAPELPRGEMLWGSRPTPLFATADVDSRYGDVRPPTAQSSRQWGIKGGTALTLLAFVVLYGGAVLLHRHNDTSTQHGTLRTAQGTVQAGTEQTAQAGHERDADALRAHSSEGVGAGTPASSSEAKPPKDPKIAPEVPTTPTAMVQPATDQSTAPAIAQPQPGAPANAAVAPPTAAMPVVPPKKPAAPTPAMASNAPVESNLADPSVAQREGAQQSSRSSAAVAPVDVPPPSGRSEKQRATVSTPQSGRQALARAAPSSDVPTQGETRGERRQASASRSLALAQDSLAKNNLSVARRAITAAQAAQPQNSAAFMLQQDLLSRERARDSALSAARVCIVQQQWNCAWHNAGSALAIDSSSVEAKALFNRAFVESGAAARPAGPGPDGPAVPLLTQ